MFEGIVLGFLAFVAGYVGLMRLMARRADVLHGEFVQPDGSLGSSAEPSIVAALERFLQGSKLMAKR